MVASLGLPFFLAQPSVAADALELLDRMQSAVYDLDYTGQLVYSKGDELSTYRITHQAGQEQESVVRLNQGDGENGSQIESFSLSKFNPHASDTNTYAFDLGGAARVAEHDCQIVVVRPKDKMRYLQRYCIDPKTGMLLKYSLMDREQQVLEQLMFTQLSIDIKAAMPTSDALAISSTEVAPMPVAAAAMDRARLVKPNEPASTAEKPISTDANNLGNWRFESLPAGFKVVKVIPQTDNNNVRQIVLSDGMAAVSVFIAPAAAAKDIDQLSYANGATHIMGLELAGHLITFVGEVPEPTLQAIQKGLRYVAR
ncbi:MucB/RseB C-terminal domain-containing protein [uncultured Thiothrix sp.]|uniref:MucB/RseB C-terminal domain-containing protein n=1 Tax=uncultured Thiothrix sp. TaxID=223185 RepID=UPI00262E10BB|nr:MucB/RseB C-terminal domain-containing protein [uncultured Thiothrix sp.]